MFQTILFQLLHWKIVLKLKGKISYHENEIKDSCIWGRSSHFIFLQNLVIQNEEYSGKDAGSEGPEWKKIKNVNSLLYNGKFQVATRRCSRQSCVHAKSLQLSQTLQRYGPEPASFSVHRILQTRILEWVGCHALLQGIFPTQGLNPGLLYWQVRSLGHHTYSQIFTPLGTLEGKNTVSLLCPFLESNDLMVLHGHH